MKERPILFSAPMVRALLAGTKTQTRRVVKLPADAKHVRYWAPPSGRSESGYADPGVNYWTPDPGGETESNHLNPCPYGQPGDRLWVREAFSGPHCMDATDECVAVQPSKWGEGSRIWYWADGNPTHGDWTRPRPSIHMPRWASRILLEVTAVRVERLQDISEEDLAAEGIQELIDAGVDHDGTPRDTYCVLWESINGPGSWDANPWVWVVEFKRVTP